MTDNQRVINDRTESDQLLISKKTPALNSTEIEICVISFKTNTFRKAEKLHKSIMMLYNINVYSRTSPLSTKRPIYSIALPNFLVKG